MNVMRRIKSITSGLTSISDPGGDYNTKRAKVEQETEEILTDESHLDERCIAEVEQRIASTSMEAVPCTSDVKAIDRMQKADYDKLPAEMHGMKLQDNKADKGDDKDMEAVFVSGSGTETGQIITTTVGGKNGQPKQTVSYMAESVIGTGSFRVVYQAKCLENGEQVAIKKVLQDKRYKNRELSVMRLLDHPNVVQLSCFYSTTENDEVYLEYVPETVYRVLKHHNRMSQHMPMIYVQLYTYQICCSLNYIQCYWCLPS